MANDTPTFPLEPGDELYDEHADEPITIEAVRREYKATVGRGDSVENSHLPEDYLQRKAERGELSATVPETDSAEEEEEDEEEVPCPDDECGETFETEQGALSHHTQVHETDDDETDDE